MEYQPSPFEPIRFFDAPGVALEQILTDNVSMGSIRDLLTPSRRAFLTPEEQSSIAERFKDQYGGDNRVLRAMLGIATNPWIWLGMAVTPGGVTALRETGSIFMGRGLTTAKGIKGDSAWLDAFGATTSYHALNGTVFGELATIDDLLRQRSGLHDIKAIEDSLSTYYKGPAGAAMLKKHGMKEAPKNLDEWLQVVAKELKLEKPHKLTSKIFNPDYKGVHKEYGDSIKRMLNLELSGATVVGGKAIIPSIEPTPTVLLVNQAEAKAAGLETAFMSGAAAGKSRRLTISLDKYDELKQVNVGSREKTGAGKYDLDLGMNNIKVVNKTSTTEHLMDADVAKQIRETLHLDPMVAALRASYDKRALMLFGDEIHFRNTGVFKLDQDKIKTISGAMAPDGSHAKFFHKTQGEALDKDMLSSKGVDFLRNIFNIDQFGAIRMSVKDRTKLLGEMIDNTVVDMFNSKIYVPRNTYRATDDVLDAAGNTIGVKTTSLHTSSVANAETVSELGRLTPRASHSRVLHPHEYEWLKTMNSRHGGTKSLDKHLSYKIGESRRIITAKTKLGVQTVMPTLDAVTGHRRYMKDTSEMWSRHIPHRVTTEAGERILDPEIYGNLVVMDEAIRKQGLPAGGHAKADELFIRETQWRSGHKTDNLGLDLPPETWNTSLKDMVTGGVGGAPKARNAPAGGTTVGDIMAHTHASMRNGYAADMARDVLLPHISGRRTAQQTAMRSVQLATQENLASFANSKLGQTIETWGQPGKDFINSMKSMSTYENLTSNVAKGLYVGFLGLNMSSVMLNMMQPLLHAAMWGGLDNVLPAYGKAFMEMSGYAKDRLKYGPKISTALRAELQQKNFKHVREGIHGDLLGIQPDVFANIEGATYAGVQAHAAEGNLHYLSMSLPMKLFEKAELMNRLTTAHMVDRMYARAGVKTLDPAKKALLPEKRWGEEEMNFYRKMVDTRRMVQEAQFGGTVANMPTAFLGVGPAGGLLNNALGRQFLSFLARSATSFGVTGRQISPYRRFREGIPIIGGKKVLGDFKYGYAVADGLRVMGTGSIAYEIGKEVAGMDVSRGLGFNPITEVMGGGWRPPVVAIPYDMASVLMGDLELAKSSIPGMVPAGIALTRAMGMMPKLGDSSFLPELANDMQKTYVDWNSPTPEGMYPVYKPDGTLISFDKPFTIVTRGLGLNLEDHPKRGEVDGYLVNQRDKIVQMEGEYINAVLSNNLPKAKKIEAEFQKRFNVPMKISKRQWKARIKNLRTARLERIADTIPAEYKHLYEPTLADESQRLGLQSPEDVMLGATSGRRTSAGAARPQTVTLDSASVEEIRQHLKSLEEETPIQDQGFNPYKPWNR